MRGLLSIALGLFVFPLQSVVAVVSGEFVDSHTEELGRLVENLDSSQPPMQKVAHQWQIGNKVNAMEILLAYYRQKSFPVEILEPLDFPDDLERHAQAALGDSFYLLSEWETVARRDDGGIDWLDRGERDDKERAWMLNRHGFFPDLAEAYARTGDERYREQLNMFWQDWILNNPYPDRLTFSPPWRALEVARRILNAWVHVFYGYDSLDDETRLLVLASLLNHGDALREHASFWGGNHLISEKLALLTLAAAWPELAPAEEWKTHAIQSVTYELDRQTYPDGSYKELSNHYQRVVLVNAQYFLSLLTLIDPDWENRPIVSRIEGMWDFFAKVMRPDGTGPLSNASDLENNAGFLREVWDFFDREDWLYLASLGREGSPPTDQPSILFPWAGQAILRNSWGPDADWIYFDAGPYGSGHQHIDRLHVSASLNGKPILVDSGRYIYQPGPWYDYFKGSAGHNTLSIAGRASSQGPRVVNHPLPIVFEYSDQMSFAAASSHFQGESSVAGLPGMSASIPWTRAVLLDHRDFTIIVDQVVLFNRQPLEARWHFHPDISREVAGSALQLAYPEKSLHREIVRGVESPEIGGFFSPEYNLREPAVEMRFSGNLDRPTTLVWILQSPEAPPLEVKVLSRPGAPVMQLRALREGEAILEARIQLYPEAALLDYRRP